MNHSEFSIATEPLVSLATLPVLLGLIAMSETLQRLQDLGEVSEELFRGDRLPLLPFPEPPSASDS